MKKILLAGPGTGKTYKIKKDFLSHIDNFEKVLILSFTRATIRDLLDSFNNDNIPISKKNCMTLHSFALKLNHKSDIYILDKKEENVIKKIAQSLDINFDDLCDMLGCSTYDQIITNIIKFAKTNDAYLKEKIGNINLLIIDEYQDFNSNEQLLLDIIFNYVKDVIILGDDDQSIYKFKGATAKELISMYKDSKIEKIQHDNICRRCPDKVVEKAANLINKNKDRIRKEWKPSGILGKVEYRQFLTQEETSRWIVNKIKLIKKNDDKASIMVLSPVIYAIDQLIKDLEKENVDFINFFQGEKLSNHLYNLIWKLRFIYTNHKILNLIFLIQESNISNFRKLKFKKVLKKYLNDGFIFDKMFNEVKEFIDKDIVNLLNNPPEFQQLICQQPWVDVKNFLEDPSSLELLKNINNTNAEQKFNDLSVNIMSIFKSKGLQANYVFIVGLVNGILPRIKTSIKEIEEQRRILFVGMTRVKKELFLVSTVKWSGKVVHRLGKENFKFDPSSRESDIKLYDAEASSFISELRL